MTKSMILVLSSVCFCMLNGLFNSALAFDPPPEHNTNTYTLNIGLKPIPQAYQLARATFLPEASKTDFKFSGNTTEGDYNQATSCEDKSKLYTTSNCKYPRAVVAASRCPFLAGYYTECKCLSQFNKTSCTAPYILGGTSCDGKYEKCVCPATVSLTYANDKCTQYCDGKCIKKSCTPTANQSNCTNGMQNCDNGCGQNTRKCCVACTHKITTKPANSSYTYSSCNDGSGSHQIQTGWKCNPGYHEKNGGCEKDCIANTCSGYTLSACPANATCSSCSKQTTTCGGGGTVYKMTGCNSGYHQSGNTCVAHSYTCPSGYQASACSSSQVQTGTTSKKCSCGATSGTCYACRAKTCEEQGKKTCNGSCISTSECCGGCSSGKKCSNGTCVTVSTCNVKFCSKCVSEDPNTCDSCRSGYDLTWDGKCEYSSRQCLLNCNKFCSSVRCLDSCRAACNSMNMN